MKNYSMSFGTGVFLLMSGVWAAPVWGAGVADVTVCDNLQISACEKFTAVTNRYEGLDNYIHDNLTLTGKSYVRLKGSTTTASTLPFGPGDGSAANQQPIVTIEDGSALYGTYRNSNGFLGETDNKTVVSKITVDVGQNGGAGKFVAKSNGGTFGSSPGGVGLWLEMLTVNANATSASDYIDILQLDAGGVADITKIINYNAKPARIIFNGGKLRNNYMNSQGEQFSPAANCVQVAEGTNSNDVIIYKQYFGKYLNGGAGTVRFQGNCNVQLSESGENLPGIGNNNRGAWQLSDNYGPIEWKQTGDIIFYGNARIQCESDDRFPYAEGTPIIRMQGSAILDVNGTSQKLRSLISESAKASVTNVQANYNKTTVNSRIVFGTGDTDGIFSAVCCDNVNVEKVGAGTLVVSNVTMAGTLTITAGRVKFVGENHIANIVSSVDAVTEGTFVASTDSIKTPLAVPAGAPALEYVKTGTDELLVYPGAQYTGAKLDVREGTLRFTGASADKWWRLTMLEAAKVSSNSCTSAGTVELNEFSLYASNIVTHPNKGKTMLNYGLKTNETGTAWTAYDQMTPGTCTEGFGEQYYWSPTANGRKWWGVDTLCTDSAAHVFKTTGKPDISEENPRHIYYRLKDDAPAVSSYLIGYTQWSSSGALKKWELHSSADGINWTLRDAHEAKWADMTTCKTLAERRATSEIPYGAVDPFKIGTDGYYNNGIPYRFTAGAAANETLTNIRVSVAAGSTLDTRYVPTNQLSFAQLMVDGTAGGGTITKFVPAANGTLTLTNVTLTRRWRVPLTMGEIAMPEQLATWRVKVDGQEQCGCVIQVRDGVLYVVRLGCAIILR